MFYYNKLNSLLNEARKGLRFKNLSPIARVFLVIGLLPLIFTTAFLVFSYYMSLFIYRGFLSPLEFLHKTLKEEAKKVRYITQCVIYFIEFPIIFLMYVFQSFNAVLFYFQWFLLMVFMYLTTLGGVKYQPFLMDAKYEEKDEKWELSPKETGIYIFIILLLFFEILFIMSAFKEHGTLMNISGYGTLIMTFIVIPILFRKKLNCEPTEEDNVGSVEE